MSSKAYRKLYELKGIVDSLQDVVGCEEGMDHPIIERIRIKMSEIIEEIEGES